MVQIKKCFLELTKQTLWRWLKDDSSGDYRRLLQAVVGRD
jgi:annexin A7/11